MKYDIIIINGWHSLKEPEVIGHKHGERLSWNIRYQNSIVSKALDKGLNVMLVDSKMEYERVLIIYLDKGRFKQK